MVSLLESMTGDHPARPCLVLSNNSDAGGLDKAKRQGVATAVVDHRPFGSDRAAFEKKLNEALERYQPDIVCLAGFMRVLTEEFISKWEGRMINIHPSLLPKYRGLKTHARAIEAGDKVAGCSVHEVTVELDEGPMLGQRTVPILENDTAELLAERVLAEEHILYPAMLRKFADRLVSDA